MIQNKINITRGQHEGRVYSFNLFYYIYMILNEQQQDALNSIISGKNVFLTGPAGSGKSFVLNTFIKYYEENKKGILYKTSMTGISALLINGITLHRFAGIGIATKNVEYYISKIFAFYLL